jgi:type VI secretion system protein ImpK
MPATVPAPQMPTSNLAVHFQEPLTAVVRLRANRQQVTDSDSFRLHMREALKRASADAQAKGYPMDDIKLAAFATVALLDESILNSRNPLFAEWPRRPLQEELFGIHIAGETFFQNVQQLLSRNDSAQTADVLEVYHLCLLLGYRGRYSTGGGGEVQAIANAIAAKIRRVRGVYRGLSPEWMLPPDAPRAATRDPWVRRLAWAAIACALLVLLCFAGFKLTLGSGLSDLRAIGIAGR